MKKTLTIITPTYNRASHLEKLYKSLDNQINKDFIWLIVDDGSSDNTKQVVNELIKKSNFPIIYKYKVNGGKHTALNVGVALVDTDLTMIVDSDDQLLPNAIDDICAIHNKYYLDDKIGVYCFLRCFSDGTAIVSLEQEEFVTSYVKYRIKENRPGDMAEVFKSSILKQYPFPEFVGEKFLSEDVVWMKIGFKYNFVFINKSIYMCEYLCGGLTDNDKLLKFSSPRGSMLRGKMLMKKECGIKQNIKGAIIYDCYKREIKGRNVEKILQLDSREKMLCIIFFPVSLGFYRIWKKSI